MTKNATWPSAMIFTAEGYYGLAEVYTFVSNYGPRLIHIEECVETTLEAPVMGHTGRGDFEFSISQQTVVTPDEPEIFTAVVKISTTLKGLAELAESREDFGKGELLALDAASSQYLKTLPSQS